MPRSDYRQSQNQQIQRARVQIHKASHTPTSYQPAIKTPNEVLSALSNAANTAAKVLTAQDAAEQRQQQQEQAKRERNELSLQQKQAEIAYKRYIQDVPSHFEQNPESLGLTQGQYAEKHQDTLPSLDTTGITDETILKKLQDDAKFAFEAYHTARQESFQRGRTLAAATEYGDFLVDDGEFTVQEFDSSLDELDLSDKDKWAVRYSVALNRFNEQGETTEQLNYSRQVISDLAEQANHIADPELRTAYANRFQQMANRVNAKAKRQNSVENLILLDQATTTDELNYAVAKAQQERLLLIRSKWLALLVECMLLNRKNILKIQRLIWLKLLTIIPLLGQHWQQEEHKVSLNLVVLNRKLTKL